LKYILSCEWKSVSKSLPFLIDTGGKIETENGNPMSRPVATQLISTIFLNTVFLGAMPIAAKAIISVAGIETLQALIAPLL